MAEPKLVVPAKAREVIAQEAAQLASFLQGEVIGALSVIINAQCAELAQRSPEELLEMYEEIRQRYSNHPASAPEAPVAPEVVSDEPAGETT